MNQEDIGKFIQQCRKEKGYTQAQLAEVLHTSDKSISRWENGKTMPDLSMYEDLCNALDIQVMELLYARHMDEKETKTAMDTVVKNVILTKSQLETLSIFAELLILVGIIITGTFTKLYASSPIEIIITILLGGFVWGFGIFMRIKIRKALQQL